MSARYIIGDVLDVLRAMPAQSVDLVLSSPPREPFLALRSYLPADHPDKAKEIGSEPTPGAFIDTLLDVVEECRRVLAPHGSLCFELGDTYAGSGGGGGDYLPGGLREKQPGFGGSAEKQREGNAAHWRQKNAERDAWPLDKSLCLVPELLRIAMVYGVNPLTGRTTPRWRARNVVRWCRPNPPVGALGDKVRPATSDILVACVDRKRYFDLDAIRTPSDRTDNHRSMSTPYTAPGQPTRKTRAVNELGDRLHSNAAGAPPLDHWWFDEVEDLFPQDAWHVSTEPYKGSHYATWPTDLCVRPILAMCPAKVCTTCGKPSERITDASYAKSHGNSGSRRDLAEPAGRTNGTGMAFKPRADKISETTGWTDCRCSCGCCDAATCAGDKPGGCVLKWRQGVVLDPFAGSGTTLLVAGGHGRSSIGIDLDERNAELARARVGMFLEIDVRSNASIQPVGQGTGTEGCLP